MEEGGDVHGHANDERAAGKVSKYIKHGNEGSKKDFTNVPEAHAE